MILLILNLFIIQANLPMIDGEIAKLSAGAKESAMKVCPLLFTYSLSYYSFAIFSFLLSRIQWKWKRP